MTKSTGISLGWYEAEMREIINEYKILFRKSECRK
jgi:hypothetical protein